MKLCKDCRHSDVLTGPSGLDLSRCNSPRAFNKISLSTGKAERELDYCESHRYNGGLWAFIYKTCGKQGRWFEPKAIQMKPHPKPHPHCAACVIAERVKALQGTALWTRLTTEPKRKGKKK